MIELHFEEAREIMRQILLTENRKLNDFSGDVQAQAIAGIIVSFRKAQEMGYTITRPENSIFQEK